MNGEEEPLTAHQLPLTSQTGDGADVLEQLIAALNAPRPPVEFVRDPTTGRIAGARYLQAQLSAP